MPSNRPMPAPPYESESILIVSVSIDRLYRSAQMLSSKRTKIENNQRYGNMNKQIGGSSAAGGIYAA